MRVNERQTVTPNNSSREQQLYQPKQHLYRSKQSLYDPQTTTLMHPLTLQLNTSRKLYRRKQPTSWTHSEAQHLVVLGVHGLSLLRATRVIFPIKRNPAQLKNDVPLGLEMDEGRT
jgi:hypothetical protein